MVEIFCARIGGMKGLESTKPTEQSKLLKAAELVDLLGRTGPGRNIRVRIHFASGTVGEGEVKWHDDRYNNGPVVAIDDKNPFEQGIIPLGGHTIYLSPPRVSSSDPVRGRSPIFGETTFRKIPIDPGTEGMLFEVIKEK